MALWSKNVNNSTNSTLYAASQVNQSPTKANRVILYQNVTPGSYYDGGVPMKMTVGQWGVTANAFHNGAANTNSKASKLSHTGWVLRKAGAGPLISVSGVGTGPYANLTAITFSNSINGTIAKGYINTVANGAINQVTITSGQNAVWSKNADVVMSNIAGGLNIANVYGGSGYSNTDYVVFSNGTSNGLVTLTTNSTGGITNYQLVSAGAGFSTTTAYVVIKVLAANGANSLGTGINLNFSVANTLNQPTWTVQLGGRANRESFETLVAAGSFVGAGSTLFPNT